MNLEALASLALNAVKLSLPFIKGSSPAVGAAVDIVVELAPVVAKAYADLKPMISNIIVALKADPATAPEHLAKLEEAEAILDADFDAAAAAALAEDTAAGGSD